ncbi:hypothetical protein [Streptomyces sp. NPDC057623]|uniref:hypothetical protein n=1 Tax=Streptomyces sp. NPDC057623 TaxID=3346187 RepID=UPI0036B458BD
MFSQLLDGVPVEVVISIGLVLVTLALARVIRNLPKDTVARFFEHRTTKYQIIASDSKGRVATMQKQRLVFLGFALTCLVVVSLTFINSTNSTAEPSRQSPTPAAPKDSHPTP